MAGFRAIFVKNRTAYGVRYDGTIELIGWVV